ncbi:serine hydrolase domain-containing protein [Segetibacter aerophilus]|nr:serine hydrolase domain-containing protein [Segetibacter aerophilus]
MKTLIKTSIVALFILSYHTTFSQIDTTSISEKLLRSREKLGKDIAFVLYKNGKIAYKKEIGKLNIKTPVPIGASSQWLTTALVLTFVQEGKLSLDDKVSTYLPIFTKYYKSYITIRQCLTHYTGIQSEQGIAKLLQKNKFHTLEEEVNEFASRRDIQTNAGTEFRYSNVGFNIAARVLEVISKRTFDRLIQDRIIRPLAMKNTTFSNENYNDALNPATGGKSSAADFTNFLAMLLNKGTFNNKQILTEASVALMHTLTTEASQVKYAPAPVAGLNYALGEWILETNAQQKASSVAVPSLQGTWPMLDLCRGYACVIFTNELSGEQSRNLYMDIKATIDDVVGGNCQ